jgi:uncharacterized membrane protein
MIALTGIVFSLAFVMVQFSATAYSPRLVRWVSRDPVISHALGTFTATFLYAIAALTGVDRNSSGRVPFVSAWLVVGLLLASVAMFIALVQRIGMMQITRMLTFTGDQGRKVIAKLYPALMGEVAQAGELDRNSLECTQTVTHTGRPQVVQAIDVAGLIDVAKESGCILELLAAIGDTVVDQMPLMRVYGAARPIAELDLREKIELGAERTFEQDPKYAIRLLVDIAIRALSPAINDPTTAAQALDQIEDLLFRLSQRDLEIGEVRDDLGDLRLLVPAPSWEGLVQLSFSEICFYGSSSTQVMRRMNALMTDLISIVPEERRPALQQWKERLRRSVDRSFADVEDRSDASKEDRQGLGLERRN